MYLTYRYLPFIQVMGKLVCNVCKVYHTEILTDLMKHIHSHQPNFSIKCGIGGCQRTFSRFGTFQNHISAYHRAEPNPTNVVEYLRGHDGAGGGDERTGDGDGGAGADDGDNGTGESNDNSNDGDSKGILVNASSFEFKTFE